MVNKWTKCMQGIVILFFYDMIPIHPNETRDQNVISTSNPDLRCSIIVECICLIVVQCK